MNIEKSSRRIFLNKDFKIKTRFKKYLTSKYPPTQREMSELKVQIKYFNQTYLLKSEIEKFQDIICNLIF